VATGTSGTSGRSIAWRALLRWWAEAVDDLEPAEGGQAMPALLPLLVLELLGLGVGGTEQDDEFGDHLQVLDVGRQALGGAGAAGEGAGGAAQPRRMAGGNGGGGGNPDVEFCSARQA
jgi:hypothetical protein